MLDDLFFPEDCLNIILNFLNIRSLKDLKINNYLRLQIDKEITKNVILIQKWYKLNKLPCKRLPSDYYLSKKRTLRYLNLYYPIEFLREYPIRLRSLLSENGMISIKLSNYSLFYQICINNNYQYKIRDLKRSYIIRILKDENLVTGELLFKVGVQ